MAAVSWTDLVLVVEDSCNPSCPLVELLSSSSFEIGGCSSGTWTGPPGAEYLVVNGGEMELVDTRTVLDYPYSKLVIEITVASVTIDPQSACELSVRFGDFYTTSTPIVQTVTGPGVFSFELAVSEPHPATMLSISTYFSQGWNAVWAITKFQAERCSSTPTYYNFIPFSTTPDLQADWALPNIDPLNDAVWNSSPAGWLCDGYNVLRTTYPTNLMPLAPIDVEADLYLAQTPVAAEYRIFLRTTRCTGNANAGIGWLLTVNGSELNLGSNTVRLSDEMLGPYDNSDARMNGVVELDATFPTPITITAIRFIA